MIRYFTAGETHGPCLTAIVEGLPAGVYIEKGKIDAQLAKRQKGYGRGGRMLIEKDTAEILSGVRGGVSLGGPVTIRIENRDWKNWSEIMGAWESNGKKEVTCPRPGHADLTGGMKYAHSDLRNVLERASARETAARVAVGALARQVLEPFGIKFLSRVVSIGKIEDRPDILDEAFYERAAVSEVGFGNENAEKEAKAYIDEVKKMGQTVGGIVETTVTGLVPGLGSYVQFDRKLDARLAAAVMSIQAIKGVEIGLGFEAARIEGANAHDEIFYDGGFKRKTNNAGGIEGGMTNGEPVIVRAAMKPIPTQYSPLMTVELRDKSPKKASVERSDVCAVPACSVVVENVIATVIADAFLEKFGNDSMEDIKYSYDGYVKRIKQY